MSNSKTVYRFFSFVLVLGFVTALVPGYFDARKADRQKANKSIDRELMVLKALNAPMKARHEARAKMQKVLEKFAQRLPDDPRMLSELIISQSRQYEIDPLVVMAIIKTESNFQKHAVSIKGAIGLMQLRPFTANSIAQEVSDAYYTRAESLKDSRLNIKLGIYYLSKMIARFDSLELALEAYNRGPSRLRRQLIRGHKIRHVYADRVMSSYRKFRQYHSQL